MTTSRDGALARQLTELYDEAGLPISATVAGGVARLDGVVASPGIRQAAVDIARGLDGIREIDDQIEFEVVSPDMAYEEPDVDGEFRFADRTAREDDISDTDPAFDEPGESWAFQRSVEEAEPYFPPTDPVVRPSDDDEELDIVGGFQDSATDDESDMLDRAFQAATPTGSGDRLIVREDEDIRLDVIRELNEDALTIDLELEVSVVNGVVYLRGRVQNIDDAENAEAVAMRVPGIVEVRDLTTSHLF